MQNIGNSQYTEFVGHLGPGISPVESFAQDASRCRRVMFTPWNNRQQMVQDLLECTTVVAGGGGANALSRKLPVPYPDYVQSQQLPNAFGYLKGQPYVWAASVDPIEGWGCPVGRNLLKVCQGQDWAGANLTLAQYFWAKMTVNYTTFPYEVISDQQMRNSAFTDGNGNADEATLTRFVTREVSPGGSMITLPKGSMKFVGGLYNGTETSLVMTIGPPRFNPYYNVRITHYHLPAQAVNSAWVNPDIAVGAGTIDNALGKVNNATFPPKGPINGFAKGTLLLVAVVYMPHVSALGQRIFDVQYNFQFTNPAATDVSGNSPVGHNHIIHMNTATTTGWVELSSDGLTNLTNKTDGKNIYNWADFAAMFRPQ